jgi:hypothetical protein
MKNRKMILGIALLVLAIKIPVYAQRYDPVSDFKTRIIDDGSGIEITAYLGSKWDVYIPARIQRLPVTSIGVGAFRDCDEISSVIIPETVTNIGQGAFWGCFDLLHIAIPDSVTTIGSEVFYNCHRLRQIIVPSSVNRIGRYTFDACTNLTVVTFQGTIPSNNFSDDPLFPTFTGNLRASFYSEDEDNGTPGTYTRTSPESTLWTRH